eukprot:gene1130-826_t
MSIDDAVYTELQQMVEQHFQSQAANTATTSSVVKGPSVAEKPTALAQHHFAQQASAMLPMEQHIQTLPYHLRVVLVAAFLAGHRGKAQDTLYDPSSQTFKRRRHSQQNSNIDHSQQIAGNNAGSATNSGKDIGAGVLQSSAHGQSLLSNSESALPNRELFTYERLSALYAHVLAYCHDTAPATGHYGSNARHHRHQGKVAYAKPTLQSLVTRLEMYGLLQAMPTVLPSYHPQRRLHCGYQSTGPKPHPPGCRTIFIKNLPYDVTEEEIRQHFMVYGPIASIRLAGWNHTQNLKGFGYVEYKREDSTEIAVKKSGTVVIRDRAIVVDYDTAAPKGSYRNPVKDAKKQGHSQHRK